MPTPESPETRGTILHCIAVAASTLRDTAQFTPIPFLATIASLSTSILAMVQSVRSYKRECLDMMERTHEILCAIINLTAAPEPEATFSPEVLGNVGHFAQTLQMIYIFVESQQSMSKIRKLFRHAENAAQLEKCKAALQHAHDIFMVQSGIITTISMADMQRIVQRRHEELMTLLSDQSQSDGSDSSSIDSRDLYSVGNNPSDLSLLPGRPKIFHGRQSELDTVVNTLLSGSARVAILGTGGIGKTSLAMAVLHHPSVTEKIASRHFISCESTATCRQLISLILGHLGLEPSRNDAKTIFGHYSRGPATVLVLDNFETPWEPAESRSDVEEFLSLLTDVPQLALIITMRGAERPGRVRWTRPFLLPLEPLTSAAALETFLDIADDNHNSDGIGELLALTGHLPISVTLMANVAAFEGCDAVLSRWKSESTSILSGGRDKRSNLDLSIELSLTSPRMLSSPGARELLGLLSFLPDGLSETELAEYKLPILEISRSRATLIRTSLAYNSHNGRLSVLVPIREHLRTHHPPDQDLLLCFRKHFHDALAVWKDYRDVPLGVCVPRLTGNLGNIHNILEHGLERDRPDLRDTISSVLSFNMFTRDTCRGFSGLMQKLPELIQYVEDKQLRGAYIGSLFTSWPECAVPDPDALIVEGIQCFQQANDTSGEARFNVALGYFFGRQNDIPKATRFLTSGLLGSRHLGDAILQSLALRQLAEINSRLGNNRLGQEQAHESHKLAQLNGHFHSAACGMLSEGSCHISLGNYPRAQRLFKDARNLLAVCGLQGSTRDLRIANCEAEVAYLQSEYTESRRIRVSIVEFGDRAPFAHLYALINLACTDISMGADEHQVRKSLDAARSVCVSMSYSRGFEACDIILAQLHLSQGRLTEARTLFEQSFNLIRERDVEGSLLCLEALGDPNNGMGNLDSTFIWTVIFLGVGLQGRNMLAIYRAFRCLGDTFSEQGDKDTALTLFETALEGFTAMEIHRGKADCLVRIGDIWKYRGHLETAETFWKAARPLFQRSSQGKDVAKVDDRLAAGNLECI